MGHHEDRRESFDGLKGKCVLAVELSDDSGPLARIQGALSGALVAGGWYAAESRAFLAHQR